jgi:hypothetical protein
MGDGKQDDSEYTYPRKEGMEDQELRRREREKVRD